MSSVWAALRKDAGAHRCSARGLRLDDLRGLQSRCRPRDAQWGGGPCSTWSRPEAERSGPAWSFWKGLLERLWRTPRAELRLGLSRRMGTRQLVPVCAEPQRYGRWEGSSLSGLPHGP